MEICKRTLCVTLIFFSTINYSFSQAYQQTIDMRVPFLPNAVTINGNSTVYYELHVTNFSSDSIQVRKVDVLQADTSTVIIINEDELKTRFVRPGITDKNKENTLAPGGTAILYFEYTVKNKLPLPAFHRLELSIQNGGSQKLLSVDGAPIQLSQKTIRSLGPPLRAGLWAAIYEPSWEKGHRRVIYTINGKARIPGRFAIDFIKLDSQGYKAKGDNNEIKNWYGYGMDVLAVSNGIVLSAWDDFSESGTLSGHAKYTPDKATGNYISIDIGNDQVVFYEHLKPGSITVKPGQKVKKGDVIAAVGFTGQTMGPHLHFHVANANSPLGAEGIPFAFDRFTLIGSYNDISKFGNELWLPVKDANNAIRTNERPAPNSVIKFMP